MDTADMHDVVSVPRQCRPSNTEGDNWCCWRSADTAYIWHVHRRLHWCCLPPAFGIFTWAVCVNLYTVFVVITLWLPYFIGVFLHTHAHACARTDTHTQPFYGCMDFVQGVLLRTDLCRLFEYR